MRFVDELLLDQIAAWENDLDRNVSPNRKCIVAIADVPQRQAAIDIAKPNQGVRKKGRYDETALRGNGAQRFHNGDFSSPDLQFDIQESAVPELLKNIVERWKQFAVGTRKAGVIGGIDGKAVPVSIMPNNIAAIACVAHVELEAVAPLRECVFEGNERVFHG